MEFEFENVDKLRLGKLKKVLSNIHTKYAFPLVQIILEDSCYEADSDDESSKLISMLATEVYLFMISVFNNKDGTHISILEKQYMQNLDLYFIQDYIDTGLTSVFHNQFIEIYQDRIDNYREYLKQDSTIKKAAEYLQTCLLMAFIEQKLLNYIPDRFPVVKEKFKRPIWEVYRKINELNIIFSVDNIIYYLNGNLNSIAEISKKLDNILI